VYNESRRSAAFRDFQLREDAVIRSLVEKSHHRCVAFKSLCDSHRLPHLLDHLETPVKGRAIWIYRSMEGRTRSAVARFGDHDLRTLRALACDQAAGSWESAGLLPGQRELLGQLDFDRMTPESAAALWWWVRNSLFFDLGLSERKDVALTSYERFITEPESTMRSLCSFLDISYDRRMAAGIAPRPAPMLGDLDIEPSIRTLCSELESRLDDWLEVHGVPSAAAAAAAA
jgi:hypothetical protein